MCQKQPLVREISMKPGEVPIVMQTGCREQGLPNTFYSLLELESKAYQRVYRVTWKGSKIPRGFIAGFEIKWAQHGVLRGGSGQNIGIYERIQEFSGPDKDEHEILVWMRVDEKAGRIQKERINAQTRTT